MRLLIFNKIDIKKLKFLLVAFFASLSSFVLAEIFVSYVIGFPKLGIEGKYEVKNAKKSFRIYVHEPYSSYWNIESGNKVFKRNNIGLNGSNISIQQNSTYFYVLGDSYIEAAQIRPDSIATSLFQDRLNSINSNFQVINLGTSGYDPYQSYLKLFFYNKIYKADYIFLVIEKSYSNKLKKYKSDFNFDEKKVHFYKLNSTADKIKTTLQNHSSFIHLFANAVYMKTGNPNNDFIMPPNNDINEDFNDLFNIILNYNNLYRNKFVLLDISSNKILKEELKMFCIKNEIMLKQFDLMKPEYIIKYPGHLDIKGNKKLSELLFEAYKDIRNDKTIY